MKSYDEITDGLWYMKTDYEPGYTVVEVMLSVFGPYEGRKIVYSFGDEYPNEIKAYSPDQFIGPVPKPD